MGQTFLSAPPKQQLFAARVAATIPPMRWLLHGKVTVAAAEALKRHRQEVAEPSQLGLSSDATGAVVLESARKGQLEVMTTDPALAQAPFDGATGFARTLVFLNVEAGEVEQDDAIDRLFERYKRLSPGRLYTVTGSRVKVRQLPPRVAGESPRARKLE